MPGVHALLSASKAKQWLACPPSARLNQKLSERLGDRSSPYAEEGTKAHAVAELKLRHEVGEINDFLYKEERKQLGEIDAEMDKFTDVYVDEVLARYYEAKKATPDAELLIEQRLDFSEWVPSGFGTGDAIIVSDKTLEVLDLKFGRGVPVDAVGNPQARCYGLGAIHEFGAIFGFTKVRTTIVQPRLYSITEETLDRDELLAWGEEIKPIAEQAWRGEGEFKPGDHCRFCNARGICRARMLESIGVFVHGFDSPDVIPDEAIPEILRVADTAEQWLKDVRDYARAKAIQGTVYPGWKIVRGKRPGRHFRDEGEVVNRLAHAGFSEDQYCKPKTLMSPSEMEKSIGKAAFTALLSDYVTQGEGALTLVPEVDKRPEYNNADLQFADLAD
jgi:hypothetical protein